MSDPYTDVKLIDKKGLRLDGRKLDELRPITIEAGVLHRADGSCYLEWGNNKVLAAVYGPREVHPRHMQNPLKGIVQARYNMASFSVSERKRPGPDRRSTEISKIISDALERVVLTEKFPRTTVDVYIEILEASAGTRCAGLTAASVALADAGIPMKDLVPSVASGKIDGKLVLDLGKAEDNFGQADVPFAMVPKTDEVVLLQMDGHLTREEFEKILEMNRKAALEVHKLQCEALQKRYSAYVEGAEPEDEEAPKETKAKSTERPDYKEPTVKTKGGEMEGVHRHEVEPEEVEGAAPDEVVAEEAPVEENDVENSGGDK